MKALARRAGNSVLELDQGPVLKKGFNGRPAGPKVLPMSDETSPPNDKLHVAGSAHRRRGLDSLPGEDLLELRGNWRELEQWLGHTLKSIRVLIARISQKDLTAQLDSLLKRSGAEPLDHSYVSKVEAGKKRLTMNRFLAWCDALGRDPAYVFQYAAMLRATHAHSLDEVNEHITSFIEEKHPDVLPPNA